jgi:hypothetical protein
MFVVFESWTVSLASRSRRFNFRRLQFGDGWEKWPFAMNHLPLETLYFHCTIVSKEGM